VIDYVGYKLAEELTLVIHPFERDCLSSGPTILEGDGHPSLATDR